jgi:hypothetical protein
MEHERATSAHGAPPASTSARVLATSWLPLHVSLCVRWPLRRPLLLLVCLRCPYSLCRTRDCVAAPRELRIFAVRSVKVSAPRAAALFIQSHAYMYCAMSNKLTWLVLGGDPAVCSHRVEQFTAL